MINSQNYSLGEVINKEGANYIADRYGLLFRLLEISSLNGILKQSLYIKMEYT